MGSAKPPHQDSAYWKEIDPPDIVTCWMALDDSTEGNGCMRFIPGSHKKGVIEHKHLEDYRVEDKNIEYENEVAVSLKAGSCTFHHSLTMHRTDPNTSPNSRIGLTVAYMSAQSKYVGERGRYPNSSWWLDAPLMGVFSPLICEISGLSEFFARGTR